MLMHLDKGGQQAGANLARSYIGVVASLLYNHSLENISPEKKDQVYQEIDLGEWGSSILELGYMMNGGRLRVIGNAGDSVGWGMEAGIIEVDEAGVEFGSNLKGGLLKAMKVDTAAGWSATGGEIVIDEAGSYLGHHLNGASIRAKKAGNNAGESAESGTINVEEAGDYFGRNLKGGELRAKKAGMFTGYESKGGKIIIEVGCDGLATNAQAQIYINGEEMN